MKVLFLTRRTWNTARGGDTTQVEQTAAALKALGVEVDIRHAAQVSRSDHYDLVHAFNLIRPMDHLPVLPLLPCPWVISTIFLDYSEFDRAARGGAFSRLASLLGTGRTEVAKALVRGFRQQDVMPGFSYALMGHRRAMNKLASHATLLLPNSHSEAQRLWKYLGCEFEYRAVVNGVRTDGELPTVPWEKRKKQVLCVGQLEGRKNQHRLIAACQKLGIPLVIVGKASANNHHYALHCQNIADVQTRITGFIPDEELRHLYRESAVHALPSWFETTGLSSLEAAAEGCAVVVGNRGDTAEYFEGLAAFCDPASTDSIAAAVEKALNGDVPPNPMLVRDRYGWQRCGEQTLAAYEWALNQPKKKRS